MSDNMDMPTDDDVKTVVDRVVGPERYRGLRSTHAAPYHHDPVNHPSHYTKGGIECIDAIEASMSPEAFAGYCKGNALKYLWRYEDKERIISLQKAQWYLTRLITTEQRHAEQQKLCAGLRAGA